MLINLFLLALPLFTPPANWEIAQLKNPSPHVKIGFLGKGSGEFRPSINLAVEEGVDVSLKEYVKAVKKLTLADKRAKWLDLGKFPMQAGEGHLVEISNATPFGEIKILQMMHVQKGCAYILTAASSKEDFSQVQNEIITAFKTLHITPDLWAAISDMKTRKELQELFATSQWEAYQNKVKTHSELGPYWQFLALKEGLDKQQKEKQ